MVLSKYTIDILLISFLMEAAPFFCKRRSCFSLSAIGKPFYFLIPTVAFLSFQKKEKPTT